MTTFDGPPLSTIDGLGSLTLGGFLRDVCEAHGDREALVFDDPMLDGETSRLTYEGLELKARQVAAGLIERGVDLGTRVAIVMGNRPENVAALFGIAMAGGVPVPLSTFSTDAELRDLLNRSAVAGVLTQREMLGRPLADDVAAAAKGLPFLRFVAAVGTPSWDELTSAGDADAGRATVDQRIAAVTPGDPGLILFSSGTTSAPKGMLHLHRAPTLQFWLQANIFRRTADARVWAPLPLFWTAGLTTGLGPTLAGGGCFVLQESFDAGDALRLLARERVTEPYTMPHQATALADHPDWESTDLSSLREVFGKSVFARHPSVDGDTTWNMPVAYGMSETCASIVSHRWDTPKTETKLSNGRLVPGMKLRVVDPETGEALGVGEDGEFALAGAMVIDRYVGKTREETFATDGYLRTGDVGYVDEDGFIHWTGRRTEMIKTGGANVSPAELEVALRACKDVRRARIVGIPDARLGEIVVLCAELVEGSSAGSDDLRAFLTERVAKYKVPREVLFFETGELPTTRSEAKIKDDELIEIVLARLGAQTKA